MGIVALFILAFAFGFISGFIGIGMGGHHITGRKA